MKRLLHLFFLLLLFTQASAQEYGFRKYTVENGLVQNQVLDLFQDQKGYLWIGANGGISRFDGMEFENFISEQHKTGIRISYFYTNPSDDGLWALSSQRVIELDSRFFNPFVLSTDLGRIAGRGWTGNDQEINFLVCDPSNDPQPVKCFRKGSISGSKLNIQKELLFSFVTPNQTMDYIFLNDTLWVDFQLDGLFVYAFKTKKFTQILNKPIKSIYLTKENELLVLTENAIFRKSGKQFLRFINIEDFKIADQAVFSYDTKVGLVLISNNGLLYHVNPEKSVIVTTLEQEKYSKILIDIEQNIWIGSESGLYKIFPTAWLSFTPKNSKIFPAISSIVEDENHQIWLASMNSGLQVYDDSDFTTIKNNLAVVMPNQFFMGSIIDRQGSIWFNNHPNIIIHKNDRLTLPEHLRKEFNSLIFYEDTEEDLIIAGGVKKVYFIKSEKVIKEIDVNPGKKSRSTTAIIKDKNGLYWFGGFNGISLYDGNNEIALPTRKYNFEMGGNSLLVDHRENIWIGNNTGLYMFDYHNFRKIIHPYLNGFITSIAIHNHQRMILGTTNGLCIFDFGAWYRTDSVICQYYNQENGFLGQECGQNGTIIDSKGKIWIPGTNMLVVLNPQYLTKNINTPQIFISNVLTINNKLEWKPIDLVFDPGKVLELQHHQNDLKFNYHSSSLRHPNRITYSYFLEGYDRYWSKPGNDRSAIYTDLPPGNYIFNVLATNEDGITSQSPGSIAIKIIPAFWQMWWFIILIFLLLTGGIGSVIYAFVRSIQKKRENAIIHDQEISLLKLSSFKNQLNPHFTFNAINSILGLVLKENRQDAYRFLQKFATLLRMIITYSDKISRPLYEELNFVRVYLEIEKLRFREAVNFDFFVDESVDLSVEVPKMIIQTFVENSVRHGIMNLPKDGKVTISINISDHYLEIIVDDNGIGRKKAAEQNPETGSGLNILNQYIQLFNIHNTTSIQIDFIDKEDAQGNATGTTAKINIPLDTGLFVKRGDQKE